MDRQGEVLVSDLTNANGQQNNSAQPGKLPNRGSLGGRLRLGGAEPPAKAVVLTGPSGSGKSRLTKRSGLPVLPLDEFYFDDDVPDLPRRFGIIDWDSPLSWNSAGALAAIEALCRTGSAEVPIYDIRKNAAVGARTLNIGDAPAFIAEGIFAGELVRPLQDAGLLAAAICLKRHRIVTFWFRLTRDIKERRKPIPTLIRRGWAHLREERSKTDHWVSQGCTPMTMKQATTALKTMRKPD